MCNFTLCVTELTCKMKAYSVGRLQAEVPLYSTIMRPVNGIKISLKFNDIQKLPQQGN